MTIVVDISIVIFDFEISNLLLVSCKWGWTNGFYFLSHFGFQYHALDWMKIFYRSAYLCLIVDNFVLCGCRNCGLIILFILAANFCSGFDVSSTVRRS